ncbi:MAG: HK97 family phage prohead protease [Lachnospiraceae bacterium]|nr:HK97 family phage prohead protease [Lachnospiraceae bacterium]
MAVKNYERRSYAFEIRAEEHEGGNIITGRPIVTGSRTDMGLYDEIIEPGALDRTKLTDVRFLVNHDLSRIPLARSRANSEESTMHLAVDEKGMSIRVSLDTEGNPEAKALYSAVKRGDISGMSFMFFIDGEEWEDLESEHPTRRITDIAEVLEVSAVTFPAYGATEIQARGREAQENARAALERARTPGRTDAQAELELIKLKVLYGG